MLSTEDTLAMIESMASEAEREADTEDREGYWDGWADGLRTLAQHMRTDVKVSCFPVGNCSCHPFKLDR